MLDESVRKASNERRVNLMALVMLWPCKLSTSSHLSQGWFRGPGLWLCAPPMLAEIRMALARLVRDFRFELAPGQEELAMAPGITNRPRDGVFVRVSSRGEKPSSGSSD